jgi:hypothetical protein
MSNRSGTDKVEEKVSIEKKTARIDSLELFAVLLFCVDGKVESLWEGKCTVLLITCVFLGMVTIFSWAEPDQRLHRFEFYYFLDSFFRGLLSLIVLKGNQMPAKRGYMVNAEEIEKVVNQVYGDNEFLDKESLPKAFAETKELLDVFGFFARNLQGAVKLQKLRN